MSTDAKEQEAILTEILLMREEMREGLRRLSAIGPQTEIDYEARELGVANRQSWRACGKRSSACAARFSR